MSDPPSGDGWVAEGARFRWSLIDRALLSDYIAGEALTAPAKRNDVPEELVHQIGRSKSAIYQYARKHRSELAAQSSAAVLVCEEMLDDIMKEQSVAHESPRAVAKRQRVPIEQPAEPVIKATEVVGVPSEISLPPRAITSGAKMMRLLSYGALTTIQERPYTKFGEINNSLKRRRDARFEAWDGYPRFM